MAKESISTTRRMLLSSGCALPFAAFASDTEAKTGVPAKWDREYDVIVVGSGVTGTVAGIRAAEKGAQTVVIEKLGRLGGTSRFSGLNFACVGSPAQKAAGVTDTPKALADDMARVSGGLGDYALALKMAENTARAEAFYREHGVEWDGRLLKLGGHSAKRCLVAKGDGAGLLGALWKSAEKLTNLRFYTGVKLDDIIRDAKGCVVGIKVRENYVFDRTSEDDDLTNQTGDVRYWRARRAVVMATGGFARDRKFRRMEVPFLDGVSTTTRPGATAGALKTMIRAGARPVHVCLYRFAYPLPTEDMIWGVMIDPSTGKRFMSEGETRNTLAVGVLQLRLRNGDRRPFMIYDTKALSKFHNANRVQRSLNGLNGINGTMYTFNTIEEAAKHYGADPVTVKATVMAYNDKIATGNDPEFAKPMERSGRQVEPIDTKGPFYAIEITPRLNYTPGGVRINTEAQVLSIEDDRPIPGLYAAGEAAGGLHGQERMTACSMPDCSVYGMIAGENAAAEPLK